MSSLGADALAVGDVTLDGEELLMGVEAMDPSTSDGHHVVYDRECPLALRFAGEEADGIERGSLESTKVKLLVLGDDAAPESVRVELSSESDLFFHYMHVIDEVGYRVIKESQGLVVGFSEYPNVLIQMLNNAIKESRNFLAEFTMNEDGRATLDFKQNMAYKFVDLLSVNFVRSPEEVVRQQIEFRYGALKARLAVVQKRLADVNALVKMKNPSLLLQLQKTARRAAAAPGSPSRAPRSPSSSSSKAFSSIARSPRASRGGRGSGSSSSRRG
eukprot:PLAT11134.1.p1 GENE.PLAT11134.1~~PLAT11134.1.p1  ORF type:complete len:273 (+),score=76.93 PLAT11134.1:3-821(+)